MIISDCCGAEAGEFYDIFICPDCRENCDWIETEEAEDSPKCSLSTSQLAAAPA